MALRLIVLVVLILTTGRGLRARDADVARLLHWLEGTFSTIEQARDDSTVYAHLMTVRRCLSSDSGVDWLYVEFRDTLSDAPFRQELWRISVVEHGLIEQAVYDLKESGRWAGGTTDTTKLEGLDVQQHSILRRGCEIYYQIGARFYLGRTAGVACQSKVKGANALIITFTPREHWIEVLERHISASGENIEARTTPIYYMKREVVAGN